MNATATIAPTGPQTIASTGPQHLRALERANKVRLARAELKRRVAGGEIGVAEVILQCPWEADSMAVADLLLSQRRWGHTRCRKFLSQIPMSEQKTIGSMTERQRRTLAAMLPATSPVPATDAISATGPWLAPRSSGTRSYASAGNRITA
jgi:hypothetical protein